MKTKHTVPALQKLVREQRALVNKLAKDNARLMDEKFAAFGINTALREKAAKLEFRVIEWRTVAEHNATALFTAKKETNEKTEELKVAQAANASLQQQVENLHRGINERFTQLVVERRTAGIHEDRLTRIVKLMGDALEAERGLKDSSAATAFAQ